MYHKIEKSGDLLGESMLIIIFNSKGWNQFGAYLEFGLNKANASFCQKKI